MKELRGVAIGVVALTLGSTLLLAPAGALAADPDEWHLKALNVVDAQKITAGSGVIVGVVDSGVSEHRDISSNLLTGKDFVTGGDGTGHVDKFGHGTEMASLIAGQGHGRTGVLGIAPGAKILPAKVSELDRASSAAIGQGIAWAAQHGAEVINVSIGDAPSLELTSAVKTAADADAVIVAGSGNDSTNVIYGYPAAVPGVLAVGATDRSNRHADFSLTGPATQLCAPGVDIIAAEPTNKYVKISGTSPATAIVSGAAALVRAKFPKLSAQEVIHRLTATATDIGKPGRDDECGYGVLNIVKALTANVPPLETTATAPTQTPTAATPTQKTSTPTGGSGQASSPTNTGSSSKIVVGIVLIGVMAGGLLAFLLAWRRRRPETPTSTGAD